MMLHCRGAGVFLRRHAPLAGGVLLLLASAGAWLWRRGRDRP